MKGIGKLLMLAGALTAALGWFGEALLRDPAAVDSIMNFLGGMRNILNLEGIRAFLISRPDTIAANQKSMLAGGGFAFIIGWILNR